MIMLMLFSKPYRKLLKNPAIYISAGLAFIIFSPVLFWNHAHAGGSLLYQFHHGFSHAMDLKQIGIYCGFLIGNYPGFFIVFIGLCIFQFQKIMHQDNLAFAWFLSTPTLMVFALIAPFSVKYNWMETFYITAVMIIAYFAVQTPLRLKLLTTFLLLNAVVLLGFSIGIAFEPHKKILHNRYAQEQIYLQLNQYAFKDYPIFVSNYNDGAGVAFYLKEHPPVFAFNFDAHQYGYWGLPVAQQILKGDMHYFYMITSQPYSSITARCHVVFKASLPSQPFMNLLLVNECIA